MIDKNLFKYELAIVAILKNEAPYIKEWIDYHLLAGVDHFYLYDNDSEDNLKEVLQPYIDKKIVTYKFYPGKCNQLPSYNEAINDYKFDCQYLAFIDGDEFIFPKQNQSIVEVINECLSQNENAKGLAINWQIFGSPNQDKADYSRGVIERFKYRASSDEGKGQNNNNSHIKTIANPRYVNLYFENPHTCRYFNGKYAISSDGEIVPNAFNPSIATDKIVINHYAKKSREEFEKKVQRGNADRPDNVYTMKNFDKFNSLCTVYDDSIEKYIANRNLVGGGK